MENSNLVTITSDEKPVSISCTVYPEPLDIWIDMPPAKVKIDKRHHENYILLDTRNPDHYHYGDLGYSFLYEPFYVGKGPENRWKEHIKEAKRLLGKPEEINKSSNSFKIRVIHKIWAAGKEVLVVKVATGLSDREAREGEIKLIKTIGRRDLGLGPLTNMTDGGEGVSGIVYTKERNRRVSERQLGMIWIYNPKLDIQRRIQPNDPIPKEFIRGTRKRSLEAKQKISKGNKRKKRTAEQNRRNSEKHIGKKPTEEQNRRNSESNKGKITIYNPELNVQKHISNNKPIPEGFRIGSRPCTEEHRINMSNSHRNRIWICNTDLDIETLIKSNEPIPEGYKIGRLKFSENNKLSMRKPWSEKFNQEVIDKMLNERKSHTGQIWIYNHELDILKRWFPNNPIPEGFVKGWRPKNKRIKSTT